METFSDKALDKANWLAEENDMTLRVYQITWESEGVVSVRMCGLNNEPLPQWQPGAHVDVHLSPSLVRQYSLCSDPDDLSHYRIAVRLEDISTGGSTFVHERLRPGQKVRVVGPRNRFEVKSGARFTFIAGGIGITPILGMVRECEMRQVDWNLIYAGRSRASMPFLSELARYTDKVQLYSDDIDAPMDLSALITDLEEQTQIYACGPESLLNELEGLCVSTHDLHMERFKAKTKDMSEDDNAVIKVSCARSGTTVDVPADTSILQSLENAGVSVASSCREGICGTCEQRVLEGVPDHRDDILSPSEQEANDAMMICVSRAQSPSLVLDL